MSTATRRNHEIDYKIYGEELQFVEIELDPPGRQGVENQRRNSDLLAGLRVNPPPAQFGCFARRRRYVLDVRSNLLGRNVGTLQSGNLEWVCDLVPHQTLLTEQWTDLPVLLCAS